MDPEFLKKLFESFLEGNQKSLEKLCKIAEQSIRPYFKQRFKDENEVNDLCQDTYFRLLKSLKNLREPAKFKSFVLKIAFYVTQDHFRKSSKILAEYDELNNDATKQILLESDLEIDVKILSKFDLDSAIKELPKISQLILKLKSEGYKYHEISNIVKLSESGVKMQMKRSIEKLKSKLLK